MENTLTIPKMGESVSEATIVKWLVNVGDVVAKDQAYIEISTDKVQSEIPAPYKCKIIKLLKSENETVNVGEAVADVEWLEAVPKDIPKTQSNTSTTLQKAENKSIVTTKSKYNSNLSPLVRKIAVKNGLTDSELSQIIGNGHEGRIRKDDILNYLNNRQYYEEAPIQISPNQTKKGRSIENAVINDGDIAIPFDRMQRLTAEHMSLSKKESAHCTTFIDIDVTNLVNLREREKDNFEKKTGNKLTYTHLLMKLIIGSLQKFPKLNAHQFSDGILEKKSINLGFATSLDDDNLIVPIIHNLQTFDLENLVRKVKDLSNKAKENKLSPEDIQGGTFTLSNTGIFGSLMGTPIIPQPQTAIMSLGEIQKIPSVIEVNGEDKIEIRKRMIASLSYDHRVINGAYASKFLKNYKIEIENLNSLEKM